MTTLPIEVINHILTLRPTHPVASIIKEHVEDIKKIIVVDFEDLGDDWTLYQLIMMSDESAENNSALTSRSLGWRREEEQSIDAWSKRTIIDYHFIYARHYWWGEEYNCPPFEYRRDRFWAVSV
jgi:hypothetical protein